MNNRLNNPSSLKATTPEIKQLTASLICAFKLDEHCQRVLKLEQKSLTVEGAVHQWVIDTLVMPDRKLGALIMPTLAQRFHEYVESIRRLQ